MVPLVMMIATSTMAASMTGGVLSAIDTRGPRDWLQAGRRAAAPLQPARWATRITSGMGDQIRELIQQRRYDEALEQLFEMYGHQIFRMAVAILRDDGRAEEATQDAFI